MSPTASVQKPRIALVVLSGGQDSTTCLFWAKKEYDVVHAVTFDYGQRHILEIEAAKKVAELAGVASHEVIILPELKSASPLTDKAAELEQYRDRAHMDEVIGVRVETTFVPLRNTVFLTIAANRAVALGADLVTGVCQADGANYPDCTQIYVNELAKAINTSLAAKPGLPGFLYIKTPLIDKLKPDIVREAAKLPGCMKALAYSHTSYDGKYPPTDMNHANVLRAAGFEEAGIADPLVLRAVGEGLMDLPATPNYDMWRKSSTGQLELDL